MNYMEGYAMRTEIKFSGFGGQGIILSGILAGKAASLYDNKHATMTQSFGPEARGSACSAQLVVSTEKVFYPYLTKPNILVSLSQDACDKFLPELTEDGILVVDEDLVKIKSVRGNIKKFSIPATRFAEELGKKMVANLVMLGFFSAVTDVITPEALKKAIPGSVPERFLQLNMKAFEKGYEYGMGKINISNKGAKTAKKSRQAAVAVGNKM
ncbi:MAG: 2-oxoacid:acceptor oxidoreductase family protein [bacterium]